MKVIVTKEYLQKFVRGFNEKGYFFEARVCRRIQTSGFSCLVWKQWFTKASGEFVAEMVLIKKDRRFLVDHAMVF